MECSSKDNYNITELFKTLLSLSKILPTENHEPNGGPLKRRSSAYVSATSKGEWITISQGVESGLKCFKIIITSIFIHPGLRIVFVLIFSHVETAEMGFNFDNFNTAQPRRRKQNSLSF